MDHKDLNHVQKLNEMAQLFKASKKLLDMALTVKNSEVRKEGRELFKEAKAKIRESLKFYRDVCRGLDQRKIGSEGLRLLADELHPLMKYRYKTYGQVIVLFYGEKHGPEIWERVRAKWIEENEK